MARRGHLLLVCSWIAVVCTGNPVDSLDTLNVGKDRAVGWAGQGAEYRALLDPNEILIGNTPGNLIDLDHPDYSGNLVPRELLEGENVAPGTLARGGSINAPTVFDFTNTFKATDLRAALEELLDDGAGGEALAFERKNKNALGTLAITDLGARFGINRIRFYPRNTVHPSPAAPFENDFLRGFELLINDGFNLTKEGFPIWNLLVERTQNADPVVDVVLDPPRYIRFIRLRSATPIDFELDEIEVHGTGFLPTAQYISDVFEVGLASWGNIRWVEQALGDPDKSRLLISTRTGNDETPFLYTRKLADKKDADEIKTSISDPDQPLSRAEYYTLPVRDAAGATWAAGAVGNDLENWSTWSTAYPPEGGTLAGTPILSPGPRPYMQFRVQFLSEDIGSARGLDHLSLSYLSPPLADQLVAEIFPRAVAPSMVRSFTYAVRPAMQTTGLRGFDTFEIFTPLRVESVDRIEILDSQGVVVAEHAFDDMEISSEGLFGITAVADNRFSVRFPVMQEHDHLLKITFRAAVLVYSTDFKARASLSTEPGSFQNVVSGNSAELGEGDRETLSGTTVLSPSIVKGGLVDAFEAVPNPFTPNGDGSNDRVSVGYNILTLTKPGRVGVRVYDLAGRLIHTLFDDLQQSGRYVHEWNGLGADGHPVLPGLYLLQVSIEGDKRSDALVKPLAVIY